MGGCIFCNKTNLLCPNALRGKGQEHGVSYLDSCCSKDTVTAATNPTTAGSYQEMPLHNPVCLYISSAPSATTAALMHSLLVRLLQMPDHSLWQQVVGLPRL